MTRDHDQPSAQRGDEPRAMLGVVHGLRALADSRLSGLAIAPGEYLADIYCIHRVATLLAMELAAMGRSMRRDETRNAEAEVQGIEDILAEAFARCGVTPDDCVLEAHNSRMVSRDGSDLEYR